MSLSVLPIMRLFIALSIATCVCEGASPRLRRIRKVLEVPDLNDETSPVNSSRTRVHNKHNVHLRDEVRLDTARTLKKGAKEGKPSNASTKGEKKGAEGKVMSGLSKKNSKKHTDNDEATENGFMGMESHGSMSFSMSMPFGLPSVQPTPPTSPVKPTASTDTPTPVTSSSVSPLSPMPTMVGAPDSAPVASPTSEPPIVGAPDSAPVASPTSEPPSVGTPDSAPVASPTSEPPTVGTPDSAPVASPTSEPPSVGTPDSVPVASPTSEPPSVGTPDSTPVASPTSEPPMVGSPDSMPVASPTSEPPIVGAPDSATSEPPIVGAPNLTPVANPTSEPPIVGTPDSTPVANPTSEPPIVGTPDSTPVASPTSAPPIVGAPDSAPVASPTSEPPSVGTPDSTPITSPTSEPPSVGTPDAKPVASPTSEPPGTIPPVLLTPKTQPPMSSSAPSSRVSGATAPPMLTATRDELIMTKCGVTAEERSTEILGLLSIVSEQQILETPGASQFLAREWLDNVDDAIICAASSDRITQRYIAALIYFGMGGHEWVNCRAEVAGGECVNANSTARPSIRFLSEEHECLWFGLGCGNVTGDVSSGDSMDLKLIELPENSLRGTIVSEIFALHKLNVLTMDGNKHINGTLPTLISKLTDLEFMDLDDNSLTGVIPEELWQLSKMRVIDLNTNMLVGTLSPAISNLASLNVLQLEYNQLTGPVPTSSFLNLTAMVALTMEYNALTGNVVPICDVLPERRQAFETYLRFFHVDCLGETPAIECTPGCCMCF